MLAPLCPAAPCRLRSRRSLSSSQTTSRSCSSRSIRTSVRKRYLFGHILKFTQRCIFRDVIGHAVGERAHRVSGKMIGTCWLLCPYVPPLMGILFFQACKIMMVCVVKTRYFLVEYNIFGFSCYSQTVF